MAEATQDPVRPSRPVLSVRQAGSQLAGPHPQAGT